VKVAEQTMTEAAEEIKSLKGNMKKSDASITCDGTWQQRGFASLNGSFNWYILGYWEDH